MDNELSQKERVRKRQTQSCDRCKVKKRKCDGENPCSNCIKAASECTMNIAQNKRGPKRFNQDQNSFQSIQQNNNLSANISNQQLQAQLLGKQQLQQDQIDAMQLLQTSQTIQANRGQLHQNNNPFLFDYNQSQLEFDNDFVGNFNLDPTLMLSEFIKPSSFNTQGNTFPVQQEALQIDPVVLNYYTELNPKLTVQNELDQFLADTLRDMTQTTKTDGTHPNLIIPELPGISTNFYLHLISMFFTYFHKNCPILHESSFLENLVPINKHHGMLLSVIFAIGCQFSRSPHLYQTPFYTPQKAFDYFINRALALCPAPEVWGSISSDSIEICQAALLLASCDYKAQKAHSWMMFGMAIRLTQKFEMHTSVVQHDFFSTYGKIQKFHIACSEVERQKMWYAALMCDLFTNLSTGSPLIINEAEYIDTIAAKKSHADEHAFALSSSDFNPIPHQTTIRTTSNENADKWMPFFSGFPKDTIFGASDFSSESVPKESFSFFQIGHLFTDMNEFSHVIKLSFLMRRAIRFAKAAAIPQDLSDSSQNLYRLLPQSQTEFQRLHDTMVLWFEDLPVEYRMWNSLTVILSENPEDIDRLSINPEKKLSSNGVLLNMMFFATLAILHQTNTSDSCIKFTANGGISDSVLPLFQQAKPKKNFRVSSSLLIGSVFDSHDILRLAYRGMIYLLRRTYGQYMPPSLTVIPPSEIVCSSVMSTLIMSISYAYLSQRENLKKLVEKKKFEWDITGVEPLEKIVLPVLDNIGQVWSCAYNQADNLRSMIEKLREKLFNHRFPQINMNLNPLSHPLARNNLGHMGNIIGNGMGNTLQPPMQPVQAQPEQTFTPISADTNTPNQEKSWNELRNEFEDEFLL